MPSLEDAHQYHKEGSWSIGPEDRFSPAERRAAAIAARNEIEKKCRKALPKTRNLELLILKSHITIEYAVETFIRSFSAGNVDDYIGRFNFDEKVKIAFMLGLGIKDPLMIPSIRLLNRIRNDIAHRLAINENDLDEFVRINSEQYKGQKTFSLSERLGCLKFFTYTTCGQIAGFISAQAAIEESAQ